jgi:23S rRNA pseudouridine1911/1915/1917 synthase
MSMETEKIYLVVPEENHLERIDKFLVNSLEMEISRSYLQKLIKNEQILVNNLTTRANYKVKTDDSIELTFPPPRKLELQPENIPLDILFEDKYIAVINKQPGLVIHPGPGNWQGTMVNGLLYHLSELSAIGDIIRPGIVHRLDKDTSGLLVVAKSDAAHRSLVDQFSSRQVIKKYSAIAKGRPKKPGDTIDLPIARHRKYRHKMTIREDGKEAVTEYRINRIWNTQAGIFSMLDITIHTGRTHQIRVHLSSMGNPIIGDPIYSKKWEKYKVPYLLLASIYLEFTHPNSGERISFSAELPEHMVKFMNKLDKIKKG